MKKLSARRRHPLAALVVLLFALVVTGVVYGTVVPAQKAGADTSQSLAIEQGKKLYDVGCATCHGRNGQGTPGEAPSLIGVGSAAVDFQVGTGRMPAQQPGAQIVAKKPIYNQAQIDQIAAYIASLGPGPSIPTKEQYSPEGGDIAHGGELFRTNCAQCHNASGKGGALSSGKFAPSLKNVPSKYVYEAMATGPQAMPKFPDSTMTPKDKKDIIAFLHASDTSSTPSEGGFELGGLGPVTEGLFGWIFGLGAMIAVAIWVAARTTKARKS